MENAGRHQIEKNRRDIGIKSMYFNRYLLVRYISALFFFTNLYWLIALIMSGSRLYFIPALLLVVIVISVVEQVKIYSNHTNDAKYTRLCFWTLFMTTIGLIGAILFTPLFHYLYPFLLNQEKSINAMLIVLGVGFLLSGWVLYRLHQIKLNKDKHYSRIQQYEEVVT